MVRITRNIEATLSFTSSYEASASSVDAIEIILSMTSSSKRCPMFSSVKSCSRFNAYPVLLRSMAHHSSESTLANQEYQKQRPSGGTLPTLNLSVFGLESLAAKASRTSEKRKTFFHLLYPPTAEKQPYIYRQLSLSLYMYIYIICVCVCVCVSVRVSVCGWVRKKQKSLSSFADRLLLPCFVMLHSPSHPNPKCGHPPRSNGD